MTITASKVDSVLETAYLAGLLFKGNKKKYAVKVTNNNPNGNWCYTRNCFDKECSYWSAITTGVIRKVARGCFIPERCMNCWKVNVIPQSLEQLYSLLELQTKLGLKGKCGIDTRPLNEAMYGGYYYYKTLEEARGYHNVIKEWINYTIGDIPVTIKRGCAPIEQQYGEDWVQVDKGIEEYIKRNVELICLSKKQYPSTQEIIKSRWAGFTSKTVSPTPLVFKDYSETEN